MEGYALLDGEQHIRIGGVGPVLRGGNGLQLIHGGAQGVHGGEHRVLVVVGGLVGVGGVGRGQLDRKSVV